MWRPVVLLVGLVLLWEAEGGPHLVIRKCGTALSVAVKIICNGDFARPSKRIDSGTIAWPADADGEPVWTVAAEEYGDADADPLTDLLMSRAQALSLLTPGQRRVRRISGGLADECCRKSCTLNEISAYCSK